MASDQRVKTQLTNWDITVVADTPTTPAPTTVCIDNGLIVVTFADGAVSRVPVSEFDELAHATDADYADLDCSATGVYLLNDRIDLAVSPTWFYEQRQQQS